MFSFIQLGNIQIKNGFSVMILWYCIFLAIGLLTTSVEIIVCNFIFAGLGLLSISAYKTAGVQYSQQLSLTSASLKVIAAIGIILIAKYIIILHIVGVAFLVPAFAALYHFIEAGYVQHLLLNAS